MPRKNEGERREWERESYKKRKKEQPEYFLLKSARRRAREQNLDFNIELSDIIIPEFCPYLNIPLYLNPNSNGPCPNSPSLDKLKPHLGYVKGNILVCSHRANSIKHNASYEELLLLVTNLQSFI